MALSKIKTDSLADDAVTQAKIADNAVTAQMISDGTIAAADLASSAVTNAKLSANAVTNVKVDANAAIAASKLDLSTITGPISITRASGIATTINRSGSAGTSLKVETGNVDITAGTLTMNGTTVIANNRTITATAITATGAFTSLGIDDNADATAITIDSSERVMIGTTTEGFSSADDLTVASSGNTGITIRAGTSNSSSIYMSDATSGTGEYSGYIAYAHNTDSMAFATSSTERLRIDSSGRVGIGTSVAPAQKLTVTGVSGANVGGLTNGILALTTGTGAIADTRMLFGIVDDTYAWIQPADYGVAYRNLVLNPNGGNVGIGTGSPSRQLTVSNSGASLLLLESTGNDNGQLLFGDSSSDTVGKVGYAHSTNHLFLNTNGSERVRIDSSGTLLVGKTNTTANVTGTEIEASGTIVSTRSGNTNIFLNRTSSDGNLIEFRKDNTTVGSIGSRNSDLTIGNVTTGFQFFDNLNMIAPMRPDTNALRDGDIDLGIAGARFKDLYLSGGVFLGGTGSANQLDDYEEGTFNITESISGLAISAQGGKYTKIGNTVHCIFTVTFNLVPSSTNSTLTFSTLPFTNGSFQSTGTVRESTNTGVIYVINVPPSSNNFTISSMDGVGSGNQRTIRANENYVGSFIYKV